MLEILVHQYYHQYIKNLISKINKLFFPCESLDSYDVRYIGPVEKDIVFGKANVFSDEIYQFFFRNVKE